MIRPIHVARIKATIAQTPNLSGAAPVSMSKKALIMSAGATCQQKRINATHARSMNHSQGRKRSISQITRQAGSAGIFSVKVDSVIINFQNKPLVETQAVETN